MSAGVTPIPLSSLLADHTSAELPAIDVRGLCLDTRQLRAGDVFVALRGHALDGREFLAQAAAAGAVAAIVEDELIAPSPLPTAIVPELREKLGAIAGRFYGDPSRRLHITAVTGTNGKTTISHLLAQFVRAAGYDCGVIGTLGASLDGAPQEAANTTPDAIALQAALADWAREAVPFVTMEASSHALAQGRINGVEIDTAVFSNLTRDHLDFHGDMDAYGEAKARLFQQPGLRKASINGDDPFAAVLDTRIDPTVQRFRYGQHASELDVKISAIQQDATGLRLRIDCDWGSATLSCPLLGAFNAMNLAAAFSAGLQAGLTFDGLVSASEHLVAVPGRMQPIRASNAPLVVVDYAHTPDALTQVLKALRSVCDGRLIAVFGCGGDRDPGKRALMAEAVSSAADYAVVTSDNPRTEDPQAIIDQVSAAMSIEHLRCESRAEAIEIAVHKATAGDCVLIAGKGHEPYQIIGTRRIDFDDAEVARHVLAEAAA